MMNPIFWGENVEAVRLAYLALSMNDAAKHSKALEIMEPDDRSKMLQVLEERALAIKLGLPIFRQLQAMEDLLRPSKDEPILSPELVKEQWILNRSRQELARSTISVIVAECPTPF